MPSLVRGVVSGTLILPLPVSKILERGDGKEGNENWKEIKTRSEEGKREGMGR